MIKGTIDRIGAVLLILIGIIYIVLALRLEIIFFNGPVGPHHWGVAVGSLMIFCSALLLLRPTPLCLPENSTRSDIIKLITALSPLPLILIGYSLIIRLFDGKWIGAVIASVVMTSACYALFDMTLGLSLPIGSLFR